MDPGVSPVHDRGAFEFRKMSVTVCSNDQTLPEPLYHFYGTDMGSRLRLLKVSSYRSGAKKMADWAEDVVIWMAERKRSMMSLQLLEPISA